MAASYRIPTPYSTDARTQPLVDLRWLFGAAHITAPAAGAELVRVHHLLNSFYEFLANLLLRRHRTTTAAPTAIALASSSSSIFDSTPDIVFSTLDATVLTS